MPVAMTAAAAIPTTDRVPRRRSRIARARRTISSGRASGTATDSASAASRVLRRSVMVGSFGQEVGGQQRAQLGEGVGGLALHRAGAEVQQPRSVVDAEV